MHNIHILKGCPQKFSFSHDYSFETREYFNVKTDILKNRWQNDMIFLFSVLQSEIKIRSLAFVFPTPTSISCLKDFLNVKLHLNVDNVV